MKQSQETDPLLGFIRQQVEQFEEIPSEKVWEGLETQWQQPRLRGRSTLLILLVSAAATLGISAMLSWNMLFPPAPVLESVQPFLQSNCEGNPIPVALAIAPATRLPIKQTVQLNPLPSLPSSALLAEIQSTTVPPTQPLALVDADLSASIPNTDSSTNHEAPLTTEKKRASLRLGQLFQQLSKQRKGNNWDYQLGIRVGTADFTRSIMRPMNPHSSILQLDVMAEWVLSHRFRVLSGLSGEHMHFDLGQSYDDQATIAAIIQVLGLDLNPGSVSIINRKEAGTNVAIPLEGMFFLTPQEKETQLWVGLGFRLGIWQNYRERYAFDTSGENPQVTAVNSPNFQLNNLSWRFRFGVEQRLSSAVRLRLSGFYNLPVGNSVLEISKGYYNQLGGSLSLFWASKRGPMRWRAKRGKY